MGEVRRWWGFVPGPDDQGVCQRAFRGYTGAMSKDSIFFGALDLPLEQQRELARLLRANLEASEPELSDEDWRRAWGPVVARRLEELRSGQVEGRPAADVFERLERKYGGG